MAVRLLVTNGCSYTRGAELADPARQAWPAVLAGRLGVPLVNLACDGGSNRRIVRTTVANLHRVCAEHGVGAADALVVCMWTGLARGEHHHRGRDRGNRPDLPDEEHWHRLGRWRIDEGDAASEAYFRYLWDSDGATVDMMTDWLLVDAYARSLGAQARYAFAWNVLPAKPSAAVRRLAAGIDPACVYGGKVASAGLSFYDSVAGRFATGSLYHPLAPAHAYFAGELDRWLRGQGFVFDGEAHAGIARGR
jgi:Family of unknown function (DUF6071)